ncbi:MAG: glycosyltransferase family 4 protein [Desulfovibrionaceae bacterium]|nr:glycosyltransferase family 4 protein [Desulfovibrionaceae bacterium]
MRTLQIVNVRWFNATAWYGIRLAKLLGDAGHESLVVGLDGTESFQIAKQLGLNTVALPLNTKNPLDFPGLLLSMRRLIRSFRPDIVNCHRGESFLFWAMLKHAGKYALIRTRGDQRLPKSGLINRFLHAQTAEAVITTNTAMQRHFSEVMHVPADQLCCIFGGVDTKQFAFRKEEAERMRHKWHISPDETVIGLLGRFDRVKGQKELLEVASRLIRKGMNLRIVLIGFPTATSQREIEKWIDAYGMRRHTMITGKVDNVAACISALDIGVIPSLWSEAIARAALEMMACARPILASSVGVMPDLLSDEALFCPGDVDAMEQKLAHAVLDPAWRSRLAASSLSRLPELTDEAFLEQTLAVYTKALYSRNSAASAR